MSGRILLVEDQILFRKALKQLLSQARSTAQVYEVGSARDALRELESQPYALVATDLCLPEEDGLWLLSKLRELRIDVPVLVVTASERPELLTRAVELGARGSLRKTSDPSQLLMAVDRLLHGKTYFVQDLHTSTENKPRLSARNLELLCLSRNGLSSEEIQRKMGLSGESFASLARSVCRKLATETLASAASKAHALGLIAGRDHG